MVDGLPVRIDDYEAFAGSLANLRMQLQTLKRELEHVLGDLDPLTGAYNRISMLTWLREQQALVRRGILPCGVAMLDLDHFKSVNDHYGHPVGDQVLRHASAYLLEHLRPYDRLFRYGGEELLCTPDTDLYTCHALVDRLGRAWRIPPSPTGTTSSSAASPAASRCWSGTFPSSRPSNGRIRRCTPPSTRAATGPTPGTPPWARAGYKQTLVTPSSGPAGPPA